MDFDPELSSDLAQYAYNIALAFQKENQEDETIAWFSISHRLDPSFRVAERLAGMYSKQGLQEVAVPVWQALYDNLPSNDPQKWWATGQIAEIRTDWFAAAEAYGKGANLTSEPYEYLMRQAYAFQQGQGLEQAASVYEVARAEKPDHPQPYLALGNLAILQGAFDRAIDWYLAAERLKIEHNDSLAGLGHAHFLKEDYDLARRYLESALQMEPDDYWAAYLLSQCLYMTGDQLQATEALNRAISNHPGQPWQWALILGDWYYEMDNGEGALKAFQLAEKWKGPTDEIESRIQNVTKQ